MGLPGRLRVLQDGIDGALARAVARHPSSFAFTQREAEIRDDLRGVDPDCRYAADPTMYPQHVCTRNTGEEVRFGEVCFYEAHARIHEHSPEWRCVACGERIPVDGGRGTVVTPDRRTFRFHTGSCFQRADEAIAALDAAAERRQR